MSSSSFELDFVDDGYTAKLNSPVINDNPRMKYVDEEEAEEEVEDIVEVEECGAGISQELKKLLEKSAPNRTASIPFFMHPAVSQEKKPSLLTKLFKFLTLQPEESDDNEPLFPKDMLHQKKTDNGLKRVVSAEPLLKVNSRRNSGGLWKSASLGNHQKTSMDDLAKVEQAVVETVIDSENILQHKYRECMRQAKTMVNISLAQVKGLLEAREMPVDINRFGDCLYLLPLNDLGKGFLMNGRMKLNIGRNEAQLFNTKSRVISRHQCQIFSQLNKFYIADVGSNSGSFVNGERLSESGKQSPARELESFDILQFGVDYTAGLDPEAGSLPLHYKAPQFLLLLGASNQVAELKRKKQQRRVSPIALKESKLGKLKSRAVVLPMFEKMGGFRLYVEFGDVVGENTSGWAVLLSKDLGGYTLVFNNYQLSWYANQ